LAKNHDSDSKDKHKLKAQRETIIKLERRLKLLEQQIRSLEKASNKPPKEEKALPPKKPTPAELKEQTRQRFADWRAKNTTPEGNE
jgi:hypothetical protein